jgi:hypothetical protein
MFDEEYKLWSSSLCSFLQPSVTSRPLGLDILLSILVFLEQGAVENIFP